MEYEIEYGNTGESQKLEYVVRVNPTRARSYYRGKGNAPLSGGDWTSRLENARRFNSVSEALSHMAAISSSSAQHYASAVRDIDWQIVRLRSEVLTVVVQEVVE